MVAMGMKYDICSAAMEDPSYIADGGRLTSLTVACRSIAAAAAAPQRRRGGGGDTKQWLEVEGTPTYWSQRILPRAISMSDSFAADQARRASCSLAS